VQVKAVEANVLVLADKKTGEVRKIEYGLCVWCTGIKMNPLCQKLISDLPEGSQPNIRSLTTDSSLRVKARALGVRTLSSFARMDFHLLCTQHALIWAALRSRHTQGSGGTIFAAGDCATIELNTAASHAERMLPAPGERLDKPALTSLLRRFSSEFPHLEEAADRVDQEFETHAVDGTIGASELANLLSTMDRGLRTLPATAQVAKQEGEFLAALFSTKTLVDDATLQTGALASFSYKHKGSLAYIGDDAAVADIPGFAILRGVFAGLVWKSFETFSQVSFRNQALVFSDMLRAKIFGRDISRV
jgi:NADH:ubiquinone reductase (non-electrogenic)